MNCDVIRTIRALPNDALMMRPPLTHGYIYTLRAAATTSINQLDSNVLRSHCIQKRLYDGCQ